MNGLALLGATLWLCAAAGAARAEETVENSVCRPASVLDEAMIRPLETGRSAVASVGPYGALVSDPAWFAGPKALVTKPSSADLLAE